MINLHQRSKLIEMNHLRHSWEGTGPCWVRGKPSPRLPTPAPRARPPPPAEANSGLSRLKLTMQLVNIYLKKTLRSKPRLRWRSDIFILVSNSLPSQCRATPWTCSHPKISWNNLQQDFGCSGLHRDSVQWSAEGYLTILILAIISWVIYQRLYSTGNKSSAPSLFEKNLYTWLWVQITNLPFIRLSHSFFFFFQLGTLLYYIQTLKRYVSFK